MNIVAGVEWGQPRPATRRPSPASEAGMAAFGESLKNLNGLYGG